MASQPQESVGVRSSTKINGRDIPIFQRPKESPDQEGPQPKFFCCHLSSEVVEAGGGVRSLEIIDGREVLVVCETSGAIKTFDPLELSRRCTVTSFASSGKVNSAARTVAVDGDHQRVFTAHADKKIRVWERRSGGGGRHTRVMTLPSIKGYVRKWVWPSNNKEYVQRRRCDDGKKLQRPWMEHGDMISALAVSKDGAVLYSASWDKTVKVWNLEKMECEESFKAHQDAVNAMAVGEAEGEGLLYTGSADKLVKVWKRRSWRLNNKHALVVAKEGHRAAVNALAVASWERLVYSAGSDGRILAWRHAPAAADLELDETLPHAHRLATLCLEAVHSSRLLISGSADKSLRVWRRGPCDRAHTCVAVLSGHHIAPVRSVRVCVPPQLDGLGALLVYSGSSDGSINTWLLSSSPCDQKQEEEVEPALQLLSGFQSLWWHVNGS